MSVEAILGKVRNIWTDYVGGIADLNVFWLKYFAAFVAWVVVTATLYRIVRSQKRFGALNIARKHMIYGALMVVFSVTPGTYVWYAFIDFKHSQQAEAADTVAQSLAAWSSTCAKNKQRNAPCAEPPDAQQIQGMLEPVFDTITQLMSFLAGLMGLLGGALGVNLISDGLLRREGPAQCPSQTRGTRIRKTITLEVNGEVLQHETIVDYVDKH